MTVMATRVALHGFPLTPADAGGRVDVPALRRLVGRLPGTGVDTVCVLGSTGIYPFLRREERRRAVEAAVDEAGHLLPVMAGVGALRTDEAVAVARDAKAAGASAGLLAIVSYTPLTEDEAFEHVRAVAAGSGLPIHLYDNPATTGFRIGPGLLGRLSRIPGVVAAKCPAAGAGEVAEQVRVLRAVVPNGFPVGFSGDWHAAEAMLAGGAGWYSVVAGLLPELAAPIVRAAREGDAEGAWASSARSEPLWALFREFGSIRVMYAGAELLGLGAGEPPRPMLPLGATARGRVAAVFGELDMGWRPKRSSPAASGPGNCRPSISDAGSG